MGCRENGKLRKARQVTEGAVRHPAWTHPPESPSCSSRGLFHTKSGLAFYVGLNSRVRA